MNIRRAAIFAATALLLAVGAVPASAVEPEPRTTVVVEGDQVVITADLQEVQRACNRVDRALVRLDELEQRINGDATVHGSLAWLAGQEQAARDAGREAAADRWALTADRRQRHLGQVDRAQERLAELDNNVCAQLPQES